MEKALLLKRLRNWVGRRFAPNTTYGSYLWQFRLDGPFPRLRTHRLLTKILGPQYARSRRRIEIDISYACNLGCPNCNRSVPQAPSSARITKEGIATFINDSVAKGIKWERIRLLGGEPTLHPQFHEILDMLRAYRDRHSPQTAIEVTSNGFGPKVAAALARVPDDVRLNVSSKDASGAEQEEFVSFNVAPRDLPAYRESDFSNGCRIAKDCGMGLTPSGYFPCAVAGGISRVLGEDLGRRDLPATNDDMRDQMRLLCAWCGHFKRERHSGMEGQLTSESWRTAYSAYAKRPKRTRIQPADPSA